MPPAVDDFGEGSGRPALSSALLQDADLDPRDAVPASSKLGPDLTAYPKVKEHDTCPGLSELFARVQGSFGDASDPEPTQPTACRLGPKKNSQDDLEHACNESVIRSAEGNMTPTQRMPWRQGRESQLPEAAGHEEVADQFSKGTHVPDSW